MFLLTCDKKLTKSQLSPTHASTKRKITDELKHACHVPIFNRFPVIEPENSMFATFVVHFGLPWVRPRDNRGNCYMVEREFDACQTPPSMYPPIFNSFPLIEPESSNVRHFITFFAHFCLPWDNHG